MLLFFTCTRVYPRALDYVLRDGLQITVHSFRKHEHRGVDANSFPPRSGLLSFFLFFGAYSLLEYRDHFLSLRVTVSLILPNPSPELGLPFPAFSSSISFSFSSFDFLF